MKRSTSIATVATAALLAAVSVAVTSPAGAITVKSAPVTTYTNATIVTSPKSKTSPPQVKDGTAVTVTITATVNPLLLGPTGTVTFMERSPSTSYLAPPDFQATEPLGHCLLGRCNATLTARVSYLSLEPGIWSVDADYSGDVHSKPSSTFVTFDVLPPS